MSSGKGKERRDEIKVTEAERERVKRRRGDKRDNVRRKVQRRYDLRGMRKNKKRCFE